MIGFITERNFEQAELEFPGIVALHESAARHADRPIACSQRSLTGVSCERCLRTDRVSGLHWPSACGSSAVQPRAPQRGTRRGVPVLVFGWLLPSNGDRTAEAIIKRRYARGEIDRETFERMLDDLYRPDTEHQPAQGR